MEQQENIIKESSKEEIPHFQVTIPDCCLENRPDCPHKIKADHHKKNKINIGL